MSFSRRVIIVAAFAVVSFPARSAVDQVPTAAAEIGTDRMSYTGAGAASCTHPLFVNLLFAAGDAPISVAIGDLDGVNGPDLAVAKALFCGDVSVLLNQGDGTFAAAVAYDVGGVPRSVAIADLDGVNGPDLAVANAADDDVSVLLNQGDGTFAAAVAYAAGDFPRSVAIGDLDGVNGPDLAVANRFSNDVWVLLNLCTTQVCPWDLDGDGGVEMADLQMLIVQWRTNPGGPPDFDGDGEVAVPDLLQMLARWGPCP